MAKKATRKKQNIDLNSLAAMVKRGFDDAANKYALKQELQEFRGEVKASFTAVVDTLDLMRADIHDIKITLGGLVRGFTVLEETVQNLDKRVTRLERKSGLSR